MWLPSFFLSEEALTAGMPALARSTQPGGWIVIGRFAPPPDPLAEATGALRTIRGGGCDIDTKRALELLQSVSCKSVHAAPRMGPSPLELVVGQK